MELFRRYSEIIVHGKVYPSTDFDIDFDITFDSGEEIELSEITIYNLQASTRSLFKRGQSIILNAGYGLDVGSIFIGRIEIIEGESSDTDYALKLTVIPDASGYTGQRINKTFKGGTRASAMVRDILGTTGLELGAVKVGNDITYQNPRTFTGYIGDAVKSIARDTGSKFYMRNNKFYFLPQGEGNDIRFLLTPETGLIYSPERMTVKLGEDNEVDGWKIRSLLNHRINIDSIIDVRSKETSGRFRVVRGQHSDFITEMEVVIA